MTKGLGNDLSNGIRHGSFVRGEEFAGNKIKRVLGGTCPDCVKNKNCDLQNDIALFSANSLSPQGF